MVKYCEVYLWGKRVGIVGQDDNSDVAKFEYDDDFIRSGIELSPIVMPLSNQVYSFTNLNKETFKGLPGMLADSLPDRYGDALINTWLSKQNRTLESFSPIERLCYMGNRGMGALEYVPSDGPIDNREEKLDIEKMLLLASNILSNRKDLRVEDNDMNMISLLKFGTSAGGARAKAIIAYNEKTGDICSGQITNKKDYGYWIIKFDDVDNNGDHNEKDENDYTRIEYAYYLMAKAAGIKMNECRLLNENNRYHFMTKRFDRQEITGEKIHMQTLGAIGHFDYNVPRSCSYERAAQICTLLDIGNDEICELYRRMIFNVLSFNNDDHVKNFSFLMNKNGKWSLAPAYDLSFSYKADSIWVNKHQMTINGKSENISLDDMLECAKSMNIKNQKAKIIIDEVKNAVANWQNFANKANVSTKSKEMIHSIISTKTF